VTRRLIFSMTFALAVAAPASYAIGTQLASRPAETWIERLERPDRVAGLKTAEVVAKLGLKPGDAVADIGAGAGVFSWPLARAVAPGGTVYAVEVDKGFLTHIDKRAQEQAITNVRTVLGQFDDPKLPAKIDLAFIHDVLHHIEHRAAYLKALATYLAPTGRIAIIDLDASQPDSPHHDEPNLQVTREQVQQWMAAAGLEKNDEIKLFDDKWFVIYGKAKGKS
jgi:ubiquinone/menaquinone biosynthesis C-methylase UbiE